VLLLLVMVVKKRATARHGRRGGNGGLRRRRVGGHLLEFEDGVFKNVVNGWTGGGCGGKAVESLMGGLMDEHAATAVRAKSITGKITAAFSFILAMSDNRTEFIKAVGKLAFGTVAARTNISPRAAKLSFIKMRVAFGVF
jgi:hypothetical protein